MFKKKQKKSSGSGSDLGDEAILSVTSPKFLFFFFFSFLLRLFGCFYCGAKDLGKVDRPVKQLRQLLAPRCSA